MPMIIYLLKSDLFTIEPAKRFAKEYQVSQDIWIQIWMKHKIYDFEFKELYEYAHFKLGRPIGKKALRRWILRTEIYSKAHDVVKVGGTTVVSSYFGSLEPVVLKELLRQMRYGVSKSSKSLV